VDTDQHNGDMQLPKISHERAASEVYSESSTGWARVVPNTTRPSPSPTPLLTGTHPLIPSNHPDIDERRPEQAS
jgi:hypothetical protein